MKREANIFEAAYYVMAECLNEEFNGKLQPSIHMQRTLLPVYTNEFNTSKDLKSKQLFLLKPILTEIDGVPLRWGMISPSNKPEDSIGSIFHYPLNGVDRIEMGCGLIGTYDCISLAYASLEEAITMKLDFPFSYHMPSRYITRKCMEDIFCAELFNSRQELFDLVCTLTDIINGILIISPEDIGTYIP